MVQMVMNEGDALAILLSVGFHRVRDEKGLVTGLTIDTVDMDKISRALMVVEQAKET